MCEVKCADELDRWYRISFKNGDVLTVPKKSGRKGEWEGKETRYENVKEFIESYGYTRDDISEISIEMDNNKKDSDSICISVHAMERMQERFGWNRKSAVRMTKKIYEEGSSDKDIPPYIKKWMETKRKKAGYNSHYIIYGNIVFVMNGNVITTVYNIPKNFKMRHDRAGYKRADEKSRTADILKRYITA